MLVRRSRYPTRLITINRQCYCSSSSESPPPTARDRFSRDQLRDISTPANRTSGLTARQVEEDRRATRPGSFGRWIAFDAVTRRQLLVLGIGQAVSTISFGMIVPILPMLAEQHATGAVGIGLAVAAPSAAKLAANQTAGQWTDTVGRVPVMAGGALLSAIGNFATVASPDIMLLAASRACVGAGGACRHTASSAYTADITAKYPARRGLLMGTLGGIGMGAYSFGPAIGGLVAELYSPAAAFGCCGLAMLSLSAAYMQLPETHRQPTAKKQLQRQHHMPSKVATDCSGFYQLIQHSPAVRAILTLDCGIYLSWVVWMMAVPLHATCVWDATPASLGGTLAVCAVVGTVASPLGGWLSDRLGRRNTIATGSMVCVISTAGLALVTDQFMFTVALMFWDMGKGLTSAAISAYSADVADPAHRGQVFGLRSQLDAAIFLVAPIGMGLVIDYYSCASALLLASGAIGVTALGFLHMHTQPNLGNSD